MNKLIIFTFYTKSELNLLRNNEITMKLLITDIFGCRDTVKVRTDVIPSFMTVSCSPPPIQTRQSKYPIQTRVNFVV